MNVAPLPALPSSSPASPCSPSKRHCPGHVSTQNSRCEKSKASVARVTQEDVSPFPSKAPWARSTETAAQAIIVHSQSMKAPPTNRPTTNVTCVYTRHGHWARGDHSAVTQDMDCKSPGESNPPFAGPSGQAQLLLFFGGEYHRSLIGLPCRARSWPWICCLVELGRQI
jgi:hypothetical protein